MEARDRKPEGELEVQISTGSDQVWTSVSGVLDLRTVDVFLDSMTKVDLDGQQQVVIDLSELRFCDVRGLAALVRIHQSLREAGRHMSIRNPSPLVRRLLIVTETDRIIDIC